MLVEGEVLSEGEVVSEGICRYSSVLVDSPPRPPRTGPLTGRPCAGGPAKEGWALNTYQNSCRFTALHHHVNSPPTPLRRPKLLWMST